MKITGQILKENRERKGVTLNEVSLATKITIKTLASIEDGNPANLPPKTFLRGFVRAYAVYLGVDVDEILRTFQEEMGSTLSRPISTGPNPSELNAAATEMVSSESSARPEKAKPDADRTSRSAKRVDAESRLRNDTSLITKGGIVGGILLLIILIVFLKGKMDSYESERATGPADPKTVETAAPSAAPQTTSVATDVTEDVDDTIEAGEAVANREGDGGASAVAPVIAPIATPTATPTPTPTATPRPTPTPTPSATPVSTPVTTPAAKPSPTAKPVAAAPNGKSHEILIEALDQVDVEVTVDGEAPRTIKLKGEQVQSIKVKRKATLKLSDGGAVNLIVNGVDRGVPGDLGKPTRVDLP